MRKRKTDNDNIITRVVLDKVRNSRHSLGECNQYVCLEYSTNKSQSKLWNDKKR